MKCYLFDIDGTVADLSHRLHHIQGEKKDWPAFFADCHGDAPIPHIIKLAHDLALETDIVFVSGRSDQVREQTLAWLQTHFGDLIHSPGIYMRREGDHRPDNLVKAELLDRILKDGYEPIMAFDDRDQVVKMWRERGIPCAQVAEGAF
jgi:hypothetical protein